MIKKIFKFLEQIIVTVCIAGIVSTIYTSLIYGQGTIFGYKFMFVPTESMIPVINPNDIIIGIPVKPEDVKLGDIVTYVKSPNGDYDKESNIIDYILHGKGETYTVVHRVIERDLNGDFIFKGDNNSEKDLLPVKSKQIRCKIVYGTHIENCKPKSWPDF